MTPQEHQRVLQHCDPDSDPEEYFIEHRIEELLSLDESWDVESARQQAKLDWQKEQLEHLRHA